MVSILSARKAQFFDPKQVKATDGLANVYNEEGIKRNEADWGAGFDDIRNGGSYPYLTHIKLLAQAWPNLRMLANFMEIGTVPKRWKDLKHKDNERRERGSRMKVQKLVYLRDGKVQAFELNSPGALREATEQNLPKSTTMVLYAVEDLSRDVIEILGDNLDVDPSFFNSAISDYAWYNTRDRARISSDLEIDALQRDWFSIRYMSARYFSKREHFETAKAEAETWNVERRLDEDQQNESVWDDQDALVAVMRSRVSVWLRAATEGQPATVIVIMDPTMQQGFPLWMDSGTFSKVPSVRTTTYPAKPDKTTTFGEFVHWAQRCDEMLECRSTALKPKRRSSTRTLSQEQGATTGASPHPSRENGSLMTPHTPHSTHLEVNIPSPAPSIKDEDLLRELPHHLPFEILIRIVCARWLVIVDYTNTRLNQIDWEIAFPEQFVRGKHGKHDIEISLHKLHFWRRVIPLYREMLQGTIDRLFESTSLKNWLASFDHVLGEGGQPESDNPSFDRISAFRPDLSRILKQMEEHQQRIDRLSGIVTAQLSIADGRRGLEENRNLARLTWLATFFIPLSLIASMFSMQADLTESAATFGWFFAASLPLAVICLGATFLINRPSTQAWMAKKEREWSDWWAVKRGRADKNE